MCIDQARPPRWRGHITQQTLSACIDHQPRITTVASDTWLEPVERRHPEVRHRRQWAWSQWIQRRRKWRHVWRGRIMEGIWRRCKERRGRWLQHQPRVVVNMRPHTWSRTLTRWCVFVWRYSDFMSTIFDICQPEFLIDTHLFRCLPTTTSTSTSCCLSCRQLMLRRVAVVWWRPSLYAYMKLQRSKNLYE